MIVQLNRSFIWNGLIEQYGKTLSTSTASTLYNFLVSFTSADTWVGTSQNTKNSNAAVSVKIYKANDGAHFYAISPNYNNEEVSWIAKGY
ncbi:hypothetical protein [Carnobacterium sp.]|uniref:gp53-like domain-containing protein n=1 Tax=Carnobacterium sp. TaxID=48221 RepID=UPI00388D4C63